MTQDLISREPSTPVAAGRAGRRRKRLVLMVLVPLLAALVGGVLYLGSGRYVETDNAYVKADKVPISTEVSGVIARVLVEENQAVRAGQPLFRLDAAPFELAMEKAQAKLAQVRTELLASQASYREKQAEIALARTKLAFARKAQQRQADLVAKKFVSASNFDDASQAKDLAEQQIAALEQDLGRIAATLGGNAEAPFEQHPRYREALAELNQAKLDLRRTEVSAPLPGTVSRLPKPGQYTAAGSTLMVLVVTGKPWIEANFTETDLTYVRPGQPVDIRIDTYPQNRWKGVVESLSPATGAEFSVIPAQNATGNWVKITQRLPVRIRIAAAADQPRLRAGLSADVEIDTGHRRQLLGLSL
ncbi:MAG: HlyD family secretion protein [Thiohalocapsa sp.]|jgi:membrane fusion protein (multidrug efflux system)|uniref:HlyD family secretion protein n=1 Tax=Thiohalocapsa sp. TaxID=2497641 RepID=UPI0025FAE6E9|nr:HlyD family secretion protein [Thiohalocapsa sp.]MCG6941552.1 HlyD family secretion protein [Thiohalocapsa sp.]